MGLFDAFKKKKPATGAKPPVRTDAPAGRPAAAPGASSREQLHHRDLGFLPLRLVHGGGPQGHHEARQGRKALHVRVLDGAVALQLVDRVVAAHLARARVCLRVLQGGLLQLQRALGGEGYRLRCHGARPLVPRVAAEQTGVQHACTRLAARAEPQDLHQSRLRFVRAHGEAQRHARDASHAQVRLRTPGFLPDERR